MSAEKTIVIVPCSGIGKTYGTVSREAAYELVEALRPQDTRLVALARLVLGDAAALDEIASHPAITIDGCKLACATKMVGQCGGQVAHAVDVLDAYRRHRSLKPQGIAALNENGLALARTLAEELALVVDAQNGTNLEETDHQEVHHA